MAKKKGIILEKVHVRQTPDHLNQQPKCHQQQILSINSLNAINRMESDTFDSRGK
jgi:hypothetical protein